MLGGRILGEGVDGCVFSEPMWPCKSDSKIRATNIIPNSKDLKYVSKVVSVNDKETEFLRMASRILGPELSNKYISAIQGECPPADLSSVTPKNKNAIRAIQGNIQAIPNKSGVCKRLGKELNSGKSMSDNYRVMYISRYSMAVDDWVPSLQKKQQPYSKTIQEVEHAIPAFLDILQRLFQGDNEQLIHIDLHTGNMFVRENPLEFGIADFGHCISRRYNVDQSVSFYGEYLNNFVAKYDIYTGQYNQTPFESRLLNFCYRKSMDNVSPATLVKQWDTDPEVKSFTVDSTDVISLHRTALLTYLLKKPLFISMIQIIQNISKKLRVAVNDPAKMVQSLTPDEKIIVDFIVTRYSIISPLITITHDMMKIYPNVPLFTPDGNGSSRLVRFIKKCILAPYEQTTMPLVNSVKIIKDADLRILWNMTQ